jgi:CheY-like chemotaxis protein/two-component sensor histidine kinase
LAVAKRKADDANLDKTRFLAAASHDVLQPLNAARLYVTSLVERQLGEPEATLARNIDASMEAVEEILNVLIEISRLDTGRLEPDLIALPLEDVFERLAVEFEPLAREKGLELRVVPTSVTVRSDRKLLRRVLQNLLSNAIKYTAAGKVLLGVRRRGDTIMVQVCDSGPGIPSAKRTLIFKEFERLQETASSVRGLGLGLSIVERIGKVLGHRIGVHSVLGRGSIFSVDLPRAETDASARPGLQTASPVARLAGLTVMCVENEPSVLLSMQALLEGWGCKVLAAGDTGEALSLLGERGVVPDIVLADYHLDEGTGVETVAAVRAATRAEIPAIIVTADHSAAVQREVRARGYALLRKPLKAAALRALMHQLTWQRAVAAE